MRDAWSNWRSPSNKQKSASLKSTSQADNYLQLAQDNLRELLHDPRVPKEVRDTLADDYRDVEAMIDKIDQGHVHIAAVGRVSVGKSSLLNTLLGEPRFSTSPLHGETKRADMANWKSYDAGGVYLIDTPGINEVDGEAREQLAHDVASRTDLVLFVVDGDITDTEYQALRTLTGHHRPTLLVLNKADRYTNKEKSILHDALAQRTAGIIDPINIVFAAANPAQQVVVSINEAGEETESLRVPAQDVEQLQQRLLDVLDAEGKTLVAINASLFAGKLSEQVTLRIMKTRKKVAEKIIRTYCVSKGIAVAFNPVPVTDILAAAVMDVTMIIHLSKVYGLPLTRKEAGSLVQVITAQMIALMGTVWAVNLVSTALKTATGGFSVVITGGAQGAVAYYATYVVGQVAKRYLAAGKSWGDAGPKQLVKDIISNISRDSILAEGKNDILARLKQSSY